MKKDKKFKQGTIVAISISENEYAFGRVVSFPFMEFFDYIVDKKALENFEPAKLLEKQPIFTILIHKDCISKNHWKVIGFDNKDIPQVPPVFIQDAFKPANIQILLGSESLIDATYNEVKDMERQAIWEAEHVEKRIEDYINGVPNATYEFFKVKKP